MLLSGAQKEFVFLYSIQTATGSGQAESARNLLLLHLKREPEKQQCLLQVCQTDAFPNKKHSSNLSYKNSGKPPGSEEV